VVVVTAGVAGVVAATVAGTVAGVAFTVVEVLVVAAGFG